MKRVLLAATWRTSLPLSLASCWMEFSLGKFQNKLKTKLGVCPYLPKREMRAVCNVGSCVEEPVLAPKGKRERGYKEGSVIPVGH